jgi:hypothetical protein
MKWGWSMKTIAAFFIFILMPSAIVTGGELLTNPGFESGMTGWSVSSSNGWPSVSTTAHSGTQSTAFTTWDDTAPYSAYVLAAQSIPYNGSNEYTFSVYARDNWSTGSGFISGAVTLKLEYYNSSSVLLRTDQRSIALAKDYQWHQYFITGTNIPSGTTSIKPVFGTNINKVSLLFDDASLTGRFVQTPPPHTGDLNNDLLVNFTDFASLAGEWMQTADWNDLYSMTDKWLTNYSSAITIVPSGQTIEKYSYVSFDINSAASYSNPYNPNDVRVDIVFKDPNNTSIVLPCFYISGSSGNSHWRGRFTPKKTGQYSYQAKVYVYDVLDGLSEVSYLTVSDSNKDGFINLNPQSNYSFVHDSGKPFRGIGENICWDPRPAYDDPNYTYEYMFPRLGASSCNFARVWICMWNRGMPLEWVSPGLGRYDEAAATRIDTILSLAEQNGIYLMLTLDGTAALASLPDYWGGGNYWPHNPYNAANGGPCANAAAFFTNSSAKEFYKKRLRYIIARWGYNPHLCVIEFFNEIDGAYADGDANVPASDIVSWHAEMAAYLKSIDPFGHLVSTSAGYKTIPGLWNVSGLDFSQTHPYGSTNDIYNRTVSFKTTYNKPYVAGEFGYDWRGPAEAGTQSDYERELHMGLWRGMFSPTPVLPLTWFWDSFADWNDWSIFNTAADYGNQMIYDTNGILQEFTPSVGTGIESMALKDSSKVFVWLRNNTSSTISGRTMTISGLQNGTYDVRYYDTWLGTYSTPAIITVTTGVLQSQIPSLTADKDIACRMVQVSP